MVVNIAMGGQALLGTICAGKVNLDLWAMGLLQGGSPCGHWQRTCVRSSQINLITRSEIPATCHPSLQTPSSHSWGKVHHHICGHLIITQKLRFWEWSLENIAVLPVHLKVKYVYLTEHWDEICCSPCPKEAHRLLSGVPWKRWCKWKQHYWTC